MAEAAGGTECGRVSSLQSNMIDNSIRAAFIPTYRQLRDDGTLWWRHR